jgi:hypothetical protein
MANALPGLPTLHVTTRALRNTPVPMMFATLTEIAAISPRPRMSWVCSGCTGFSNYLVQVELSRIELFS